MMKHGGCRPHQPRRGGVALS